MAIDLLEEQDKLLGGKRPTTTPATTPVDLLAYEAPPQPVRNKPERYSTLSWSQGKEPSVWDTIRSLFPDDSAAQSAKAANALAYSDMFKIAPSVAYDYHDDISKQVQQRLSSEKIATEKRGLVGAAKAGFDSSIIGMMMEQKAPQPFESVSQAERWINGLVSMGADLPFFMAGYAIGGGNPISGTAGGFGLTAGLRQVLTDRYRKGEVRDFGDFVDRTTSALKETVKGQLVGAFTGGAAGMAAPLWAKMVPGVAPPLSWKTALELSTMTAAGKFVEGHIPTARDFFDNATLLLTMHAGSKGYESAKTQLPKIKERLFKAYEDTGATPKEITSRILSEPADPQADILDIIDRVNNEIKATQPREAKTEEKGTGQPSSEGEIVQPGASSQAEGAKPVDRGAEAPPPEPKGADVAGTTIDFINQERAAKGQEPLEGTKGAEGWKEEVHRQVDAGEINPRQIANRINNMIDNGDPVPPLSKEQNHALLYDQMRIKNEGKEIDGQLREERAKGDYADKVRIAVLEDRWSRLDDAYQANQRALVEGHSSWGKAGNEYQQMMREDYSLFAMERRAREDGVPITPEYREKLKGYADEIARLQETLDKLQSDTTATHVEAVVEGLRREEKLAQRKQKRAAKAEDLDAEFEQLAKEFNQSLGGLHSVTYVPHEVAILVSMARNRIQKGIVKTEDIIDSIFVQLQNSGVERSKREIQDILGEYGKNKQMSQEEINVQLREVRRQARLFSALEDAKSGKEPLNSGFKPDAKTDRVRELTREIHEAMRESGLVLEKDPQQRAEERYLKHLGRLEEEYQRRLDERDFAPKKRGEPPTNDAIRDAQFKLEQKKAEYARERVEDRIANYGTAKKIGFYTMEAMNLSRAIKTSFDLSAVLRQGAFIFLAHPIEGAKLVPQMFEALKSPEGQFRLEQEIKQNPNYRDYQKYGLYLSEHGQTLVQMEEAYMSRWAEKIPGVAASQRAYTTFLNLLRAQSFDRMKEAWAVDGKLTEEQGKALANFINVATGRGSVGGKEGSPGLGTALVSMNTIFFAPRYALSRFQLLLGQPMWEGTSQTRWAIAKEYGRFLAGVGTVLTLGLAAGADLELDPTSSDFLKMRWGNSRLDPFAGLLQTTVLMSRVALGEKKQLSGRVAPIRGDYVPYGGDDTNKIIWNFIRSKFSPVVGTTLDVVSGKDVVGDKVTLWDVPEKMLLPMSFRDVYEAMQDQGVPAGAALGTLGIFGMGLQTFDPLSKDRR